mmetsp:Transcript_34358/g.79323  ORF Transcript_34358/g.79323 Transcript_34358/m.79323 type:complete len:107 (+) Transcript_34358:344-664(+)
MDGGVPRVVLASLLLVFLSTQHLPSDRERRLTDHIIIVIMGRRWYDWQEQPPNPTAPPMLGLFSLWYRTPTHTSGSTKNGNPKEDTAQQVPCVCVEVVSGQARRTC